MSLRLAGIALFAIIACGASVLVGGASLPFSATLGALVHPHAASDANAIVWQLRMPRIASAALVGASLSLAGAMLQGMLRNPIVDPYLTGVSAGAGAAIAIAVALGAAAPSLPALGFASGIATALLVTTLARRGTGIDATRLILAGVSLSALFSAAIALVLTRVSQSGAAEEILAWIAGSLAGRGWSDVGWTLPYLVAGVALGLLAVPALNALRLGDARAEALGVNVSRAQWMVLSSASLLAAGSVALAGIVGFVGLIVPHIARRLVGTDMRCVIPAAMLFGAGFMALADAASRTLFAPTELPIGVLLAFIGVPTFLYLYLQRRVPT
ncbi:MAG: iron ABC transporter permease [Candidatus Eremiobacteraeota bacterium]|nr:iron ABC transporter permease [Candidatus Eremiobacteraeota bacterium]